MPTKESPAGTSFNSIVLDFMTGFTDPTGSREFNTIMLIIQRMKNRTDDTQDGAF